MSSKTGGEEEIGTMDILAAAFFVIAGAWLLVALLYSTLVLVFLRLRARGELGSIYEEDFGRIYLCCGGGGGRTRQYYIPMGCIFRRYIAHLQYDAGGAGGASNETQRNVRFMTRSERRGAMEILLLGEKDGSKQKQQKNRQDLPLERTQSAVTARSESDVEQQAQRDASTSPAATDKDDDYNNDDDNVSLASSSSSSQEPICTICLGEYDDENDPAFLSKTCSHHFHSSCILDWLQRQANTECPCCRVAMVTEDDVWDIVKKQRKARKRQLRKRRKQQGQGQEQEPDVELGDTENSEDTEGGDDDAVIEEVRTPPMMSSHDSPTASADYRVERLDV